MSELANITMNRRKLSCEIDCSTPMKDDIAQRHIRGTLGLGCEVERKTGLHVWQINITLMSPCGEMVVNLGDLLHAVQWLEKAAEEGR